MRKHHVLVTVLCLALLAWGTAPAQAQSLGADCAASQIGTSTITADQKHIVACLKKDTGIGQYWRGMSNADQEPASGTFCGVFPYHSVTYRMGDCNPNKIVYNAAAAISCNGLAPLTCPSGYTMRALVDYVKSEANGCGGTSDYGFKIYTCMKN